MQANFADILQAHTERYPLMKAQDLAKLAYQNEYGPAHLAFDPEAAYWEIDTEWGSLAPNIPFREPEPIGNGLSRFHMNVGCDTALAAPLLTELCLRTAAEYTGSHESLTEKLSLLGSDPWFAEWAAAGCPPIRHSDTFRIAYTPHYRVLRTDYAGYFPVLFRIAVLLQRQHHVVIAIDGRCGSGKTVLAELIASIFDSAVFHTDDYYLPLDQREPDWENIPGGNIDLERFRNDVLIPAFEGRAVYYCPYDCQTSSYREAQYLPPKSLTIIEGSYSLHPDLDARYDLNIFLTSSPAAQTRRLKAREGDYFRMFKTRWIPMEERYISRHHINRDAITIDTTDFFD